MQNHQPDSRHRRPNSSQVSTSCPALHQSLPSCSRIKQHDTSREEDIWDASGTHLERINIPKSKQTKAHPKDLSQAEYSQHDSRFTSRSRTRHREIQSRNLESSERENHQFEWRLTGTGIPDTDMMQTEPGGPDTDSRQTEAGCLDNRQTGREEPTNTSYFPPKLLKEGKHTIKATSIIMPGSSPVLIHGNGGAGKTALAEWTMKEWFKGHVSTDYDVFCLVDIDSMTSGSTKVTLAQFLNEHSKCKNGAHANDNFERTIIWFDCSSGIPPPPYLRKKTTMSQPDVKIEPLQWCWSILHGDVLQESYKIITSRPVSNVCGLQPKCYLELFGFTREDIKGFIETNVPERNIELISHMILDNPIFVAICMNPLWCCKVCNLLQEDTVDKNTYTQIVSFLVQELFVQHGHGVRTDDLLQQYGRLAAKTLVQQHKINIPFMTSMYYKMLGIFKTAVTKMGLINFDGKKIEGKEPDFPEYLVQELLGIVSLLANGIDIQTLLEGVQHTAQRFIYGIVFDVNCQWTTWITQKMGVDLEKAKTAAKSILLDKVKVMDLKDITVCIRMIQNAYESQDESLARAVAEKLAFDHTLKLSIQLTEVDVRAISYVMSHQGGLKTVEINNTGICNRTLPILQDFLANQLSLEIICLRGNNLTDDGANCLAETLLRLPKLRIVDISENNFTHAGLKKILEKLKRSDSFEELIAYFPDEALEMSSSLGNQMETEIITRGDSSATFRYKTGLFSQLSICRMKDVIRNHPSLRLVHIEDPFVENQVPALLNFSKDKPTITEIRSKSSIRGKLVSLAVKKRDQKKATHYFPTTVGGKMKFVTKSAYLRSHLAQFLVRESVPSGIDVEDNKLILFLPKNKEFIMKVVVDIRVQQLDKTFKDVYKICIRDTPLRITEENSSGKYKPGTKICYTSEDGSIHYATCGPFVKDSENNLYVISTFHGHRPDSCYLLEELTSSSKTKRHNCKVVAYVYKRNPFLDAVLIQIEEEEMKLDTDPFLRMQNRTAGGTKGLCGYYNGSIEDLDTTYTHGTMVIKHGAVTKVTTGMLVLYDFEDPQQGIYGALVIRPIGHLNIFSKAGDSGSMIMCVQPDGHQTSEENGEFSRHLGIGVLSHGIEGLYPKVKCSLASRLDRVIEFFCIETKKDLRLFPIDHS